MSLLLTIETSTDTFRVLCGTGGEVVFDSTQAFPQPSRDLTPMVTAGLEAVGAKAADLAAIILNIGPGGLTYVRSGVAFANALAFSLGIPIYPFHSFEIFAEQSHSLTALPVVCVIPAAGGQGYAAVLRGASVEIMRFGPVPEVIAQVGAGLSEIAIVGRNRDKVAAALPGVQIVDTGIDAPDARVLHALGRRAFSHAGGSAKQVVPLNEQAAIFYEQT